jgi:predicted HTH transcriptional regulator
LDDKRKQDPQILEKVVKTICGIANIGPKTTGKLLIGVTDKQDDATRIKKLDGIEPKKIGKRFVVGIAREAKALGVSTEKYFALWKDGIKNSKLSDPLKGDVLSNIDFNSFYGMGVIAISIPPQKTPSYVGDEMYWRDGDSTELATNAKKIAEIAARF